MPLVLPPKTQFAGNVRFLLPTLPNGVCVVSQMGTGTRS